MRIRFGYRIDIACPQPTAFVSMLDVHPDRRFDLHVSDRPRLTHLDTGQRVGIGSTYVDTFGNICRRFVAPVGTLSIEASGLAWDFGQPEPVGWSERQLDPHELPADTLAFLLGSRYCETDRLCARAWALFGGTQPGWPRVQAICDFVHAHIRFDYNAARATRTALEAYEEATGVCRDFAHLAIAFCRCMNIPARYCTGYLGDIGVPFNPAPGDFSAWFEVYLGGKWWTLDARHNVPRIGRILIGRGRDAMDVPILNSFGPHSLMRFDVVTQECDVPSRTDPQLPVRPETRAVRSVALPV